MKLSILWPTYGNAIRMGGATNRMGGATSFPYPAPPSQVKSLLNAAGAHRTNCLIANVGQGRMARYYHMWVTYSSFQL